MSTIKVDHITTANLTARVHAAQDHAHDLGVLMQRARGPLGYALPMLIKKGLGIQLARARQHLHLLEYQLAARKRNDLMFSDG